MEAFFCLARCRFSRLMVVMQLVMGVFVICISMASLHRFYTTDSFLPGLDDSANCARLHTVAAADGYAGFDIRALADRVDDVLVQLAELQDKLEATALKIGKKTKKKGKAHGKQENMTLPEFRRFLEDEVIHPLYGAHISLRLIRIPRPDPDGGGGGDDAPVVDPLVNFFMAEETRKYVTTKGNREGRPNVYGTNRTYGSIGHACVLMRRELDEYMSYDVGSYCPDDWDLGQRLMLGGCDPLPRRRCLARASKLFQRPLPINESLWRLPDDGNVRWSRYHCRGYRCLSARNPRPGYSRCVGCFDMDREKRRWVNDTSRNASLADFRIDEVLAVKPGEVRIGVDVSVGTGSFAARMRERGVTIVSAALNLGAPFAETVALRGLVPLYATMSQRLPFFDNTMDMVHTAGFFEGWVDLQLLDFVLFDWDRVLRPGGLLWVDRFACARRDLDDYMYMFLQFRYKKHRWVVSFKSKDEVYLSALLEKPPRS
ncbi:probable methyltransferase At1g29790 [Triticum urartu]|uniref:Methyltransferase type 11 domain-containing protein n=1 Tax=Triticum urartu TaxID=4572 RepID=A0A8R7V2X1_TRIUA|nr:probable methyltransferase At1g29790 [Triticum urartu]